MSRTAVTEPEQRKPAEAKREAKQAAFDADTRAVLAVPAGRRVLYRLLERAGVYRSSYAPNAMEIARNEGRRETGLLLIADLERAEPGTVLRLAMEHQRKDDDG